MGLLTDKVALVTGGTSGIGRAVAIDFAREGAQVVLCGRRKDAGRETVEMIEAGGGTAIFLKTDVSKAEEVERLVTATVDMFGRLDVAFNNAGVGGPSVRLADLSEEDYDRHFDINVRSMFLSLKYEIQQMLKQGHGGSIVNNASVQSHIAMGFSAHYTACKHAILGYTRAAAVDYARKNIRVNAVSPGLVMTAMMDGIDPDAPESAAMMNRIPARRIASPEDVVGAVTFLASDRASYSFGAALAIDGGWLAH